MTSAEYQAYIAKPKGGRQPGGGNQREPNRTEARFIAHLRQFPDNWVQCKPMNFRLAPDLFYMPDVIVTGRYEIEAHAEGCIIPVCSVNCYDVKGRKKDGTPYVRETALAKIKMAARLFPWCHWAIVWPDGNGGWSYRSFEADR